MNKMLSFSFFLPLFICVSNWFSLLPSFVHVARHINWLDSLNFDNTNFHLFYKPIQIIFTVFISNDSQSFFIVSLFNCILKKSLKKRQANRQFHIDMFSHDLKKNVNANGQMLNTLDPLQFILVMFTLSATPHYSASHITCIMKRLKIHTNCHKHKCIQALILLPLLTIQRK